MSAGFLHLYVAEQTSGPLGLTPGGYTGLTPGVLDDWGIFGIFPAATAALRASTHSVGNALGFGEDWGNGLDQAKTDMKTG